MPRTQRIRAVLFYLCVCIFLIGLPFILSFALSYKFNTRTFKFTKAGLIAIKTQPQGASIYLDGKLINDKTPATINELLPGRHSLRLELENYYAWISEVNVEAGKVALLEKIILFPLRANVTQLNKEKVSSFWVDKEREKIYYIDQDENVVYRSDLEGDNFEEIGILPDRFQIKECKLSPDRRKLICFNLHQAAVMDLEQQLDLSNASTAFMLDYPSRRVIDVFWHSDSYHLIVVTDRNIEVQEASPGSTPVNLINLNKRNTAAFYDDAKDSLYFMDTERAEDGRLYDNVYRLDLGTRLSPFKGLISPKSNESN